MEPLLPRRGFLAGLGAVAATAAFASSCSDSGSGASQHASGYETIPYEPSSWVTDHVDGTSTTIAINRGDGQRTGTLSVHRNRLRVTADRHHPAVRECHLLDSTEGFVDSEISSTWYPQVVHGKAPQMGHIHRAGPDGGIVIDQDVFSDTTTWLSVWSWDGKNSLYKYGTVPAKNATTDRPVIVGWERPASNPGVIVVDVDQTGGVQPGDQIRIVGTGEPTLDRDWNVSAVYVNARYALSVTGPLLVLDDPGHPAVVPYTPIRGVVEYQAGNARALYPCRVKSRVIGNRAQAKKWNARVPEPPWQAGAYRGGQVWELDLSTLPKARVPDRGKCGILANHLKPGAYLEYDDVTITRL